jgi:DNA-directed RNA polymerase subunit RPC12/RpoP
LILFVEAAVKSIFELGRSFPWTKPDRCPRCGGRIWSHGFTSRYFDGCAQALLMRRYRCSDCRLVLTARPAGYLSRFQASIADIRDSLAQRLRQFRWKKNRSTSRQRHWLKGLLEKIRCHLGCSWNGNPMDAFEQFLERGICPVGRSI